jgi:hypothetical protein
MAPHTLTFTQTYTIILHIYVYLWIQILLPIFNKRTLVFVTVLYTAILSLKLQDFMFSKWQRWHSRLLVYESGYWQFRERCWLHFLVLRKTQTWHSSCKLHCRHICNCLFILQNTVSLNDIKKYLYFIFMPNIIYLSPKFTKLWLSNWKVNEIVRMAWMFPLTRLKLILYHKSKNTLGSTYYWYKSKEIKLN